MNKDYIKIRKISKTLAEEDLKEAINRGVYFSISQKNLYYSEKFKEHFSNILPGFSVFTKGEGGLDEYKKLLTEAKGLAEEDLEEATNRGVYFSISQKNLYYSEKFKEHFSNIYEVPKNKPSKTEKKTSGAVNTLGCFISSKRECKALEKDGKLVFIAGSADEEFREEVEAIIDILKNKGFAPYFAVFEEKYNEDAFCEKICSKIISSAFCIVMLNSPLHKDAKKASLDIRFPSANVFFEYGMMTTMKKKVIPIIKRGQKLPFNVQHLDALMYNNVSHLTEMLDKAIKQSSL